MAWSPQYATAAELRAYLRGADVTETTDAQLNLDIEAASRAIDFSCQRQFGVVAAPEIRYYTPKWYNRTGRYIVDIDDLMTQTGAVILLDSAGDLTYATTVDLSKCQFTPFNAAATSRPWNKVTLPSATSTSEAAGAVKMTGTWGWSAVPGTIKEATLLQASRLTHRRDAWAGIAGSPEMGNEVRLLAKLDPDVANMVKPYVHQWIGV